MSPERRKDLTDAYIRTCRDSGFKLTYVAAAHFVAQLMKSHPLSVMKAVGGLDNLKSIAAGTHPVCAEKSK